MPGKAAKVVISVRQQEILLDFSRSRSEPVVIVQRATIILRAFAGLRNEEISREVNLERKQVGIWRKRWQAGWAALCVLECDKPRQLRESIREMLRDSPRAGCKGTFTAEQVTAIIAVACEPPSQSGRPITHWTQREVRDEVVKRKIVPSISVAQVGRYLREAALQPHRRKMWLNTDEKDPVQFQKEVEAVCETYLEAPAREAADGTHTVCIDEMTGLQALERNADSKPAKPGMIAREEFEYTRHGTTTLIASFEVTSGQMVTTQIGPTRTEADYLKHVQQTVKTDPDAPWIFVNDRLNVHCSESLVEWVAKECELDQPLGKKREGRNSENAGQPA
jgi:hypothetical protein